MRNPKKTENSASEIRIHRIFIGPYHTLYGVTGQMGCRGQVQPACDLFISSRPGSSSLSSPPPSPSSPFSSSSSSGFWGKHIYSKTVLLSMSATCYAGSDRQFDPRVAINCRNFDFTLLFEDAVLILLPSSLFMILFLARLEILRRNSVKVMSYKLAASKVVG